MTRDFLAAALQQYFPGLTDKDAGRVSVQILSGAARSGDDEALPSLQATRHSIAVEAMKAIIGKVPFLKDRDPDNVMPDVPLVTLEQGVEIREAVAELAYRYADAMLKEGLKDPTDPMIRAALVGR
jgi:hypothetical protein